jgi:hypothetical protein
MRYTKLPSNFWNSKSGRAVRACGPEALQVYLYLRSCEMGNYVGFFRLNVGYAAVDLGISETTLMEYVEKFSEAGLVMIDSATDVLWIIDQAEVQVGELKDGDKQIIGINKNIAAIERSSIRDAFFNRYHKQLKLSSALAPSTPTEGKARAKPGEEVVSHQDVVSKADLELANAKGCLTGVLDALMLMRDLDRQNYPADHDRTVYWRAEILSDKFGDRRAAKIILDGIADHDLNLKIAHQFRASHDI